jgi:hypothetical protein
MSSAASYRTSLTVYTAITGAIADDLRPIAIPEDPLGRDVRFVCFTERGSVRPAGWFIRPLMYNGRTDRVTARWHKIMSHQLFPESDFTLWHDATHSLRCNPWELVDRFLPESKSLATFQHPRRSTVFEEISACEAYGMDIRERLREQREAYLQSSYPGAGALYETRCLIRKADIAVSSLNERWFNEIDLRSCRDQISLPFVIWMEQFDGLQIIPGSSTKNPFFHYRPHPRERRQRRIADNGRVRKG